MTWNQREFNKQENLFRSYYCLECKQKKVCGTLSKEYCCFCVYQKEQEKAKKYSDYEKILFSRRREKRKAFQQLELLRSYSECKECRSKEADAYFLYEESKLVCQPCLIRKEGSSSSPISFYQQQKWYKKHWGIDLEEWLTKFKCLPVNAECAGKWLKDQNHLNSCRCLEKETKKLVELLTNSLQESKEELAKCKCETSSKLRVDYIDGKGDGWIYCEKCEVRIESAGHHGVIKNRNDPKFWGLEVSEKVLCLKCLEEFREKMSISKKYTFNKYLRRYLSR